MSFIKEKEKGFMAGASWFDVCFATWFVFVMVFFDLKSVGEYTAAQWVGISLMLLSTALQTRKNSNEWRQIASDAVGVIRNLNLELDKINEIEELRNQK